jgi:hypothetical protein
LTSGHLPGNRRRATDPAHDGEVSDPDRFLDLCRKARAVDIEIGKADKKVQEALFTLITDRDSINE